MQNSAKMYTIKLHVFNTPQLIISLLKPYNNSGDLDLYLSEISIDLLDFNF